MNEISFLAGKVLKRTLPALSPPLPAPVPALKRLLLAQGELAQICDGERAMHYIAVIELRPGAERGNHFHRSKEEWVYVISGELEVRVQAIDSGERASFPLVAGELVCIQPGVAHVLVPCGPGYAIEFSPQRYDAADMWKFAMGSS